MGIGKEISLKFTRRFHTYNSDPQCLPPMTVDESLTTLTTTTTTTRRTTTTTTTSCRAHTSRPSSTATARRLQPARRMMTRTSLPIAYVTSRQRISHLLKHHHLVPLGITEPNLPPRFQGDRKKKFGKKTLRNWALAKTDRIESLHPCILAFPYEDVSIGSSIGHIKVEILKTRHFLGNGRCVRV